MEKVTLTIAGLCFLAGAVLCAFGLIRWGLTAIGAGLFIQTL